jgi:hypothetical protein
MALALYDAVVLARSFFNIQNWVSCVGCESGNASSAEAGPTCESGNASSAQAGPTYFNSSGVVQRGIDHSPGPVAHRVRKALAQKLSKAANTSPGSEPPAAAEPPATRPYASAPSTVPMLEPGTVRKKVDAWGNSSVPPVESPLPPISSPAELPVPPHAPEDSRSDSASAPSVKRQRQPPASSTCAHSQSLAPPFHPDACGNHLGDKSRTLAVWGKKGRKNLPDSYWDDKCSEIPTIDFVLKFFQLRHDRNGDAMSNKLGMPEQQENGWWRLPIKSPGKSFGEQWCTAWHGTNFKCLYSILYHDELLESNKEGHMKQDLPGVYCHKPGTSGKAENYLVFENVFSNTHWWGAKLELSVDRAVGKTAGDQWVQPAESVILRALWVCGRTHDQMKNNTWFWVSPWDPKVEVNPSTIFPNGVTPLRAKRDMQAFKNEQIGQALTRSFPVYGGPSTETLILEAKREAAALQARQHSLAGTSEAVSASDSQMELDALDDDKTADNRDSDVDFEPDWDGTADQDSTATAWAPSNSAAVGDPAHRQGLPSKPLAQVRDGLAIFKPAQV